VPTGASTDEAAQASALTKLVAAARDYSGTFDVTDYRWFNLRDSNSSTTGSLPGAATTFATDGLLRDDYAPKPAYSAYQAAIAAYGRCAAVAPRIHLRHQRRAVRQATVYRAAGGWDGPGASGCAASGCGSRRASRPRSRCASCFGCAGGGRWSTGAGSTPPTAASSRARSRS
jgi:hypothetical protein